MKVTVSFRETNTYHGEIEMTPEEYADWNRKFDDAKPVRRRELEAELFEKCFPSREPSDYGDPELEDFCK